jgi:hypothetical protein
MNAMKIMLAGIGALVAIVGVGVESAEAQTKKMVVLVDASGSMDTLRAHDELCPPAPERCTRFAVAKALSVKRIVEQRDALTPGQSLGVSVYSFNSVDGLVLHTAQFVDPEVAIDKLEDLENPRDGTPLADSLCTLTQDLYERLAAVRILQLSSDGLENASIGECKGVDDPEEPYSDDSWQGKVDAKVKNHPDGVSMVVAVDLFEPGAVTGSFAATNLEPNQPVAASSFKALAAGPSPAERYFRHLATLTGGTVEVIKDDQPLPVLGDLDGNRCVDQVDAFEVLRRFGQRTPAVDGKYDFDRNGVIGFNDFAVVTSQITGACGEPDELVPAAPVRCNSGSVVIDGRSIETAGMAIDVRGSCQLTIRNSRIVSGGTALRIRGSAVVTIEDSIIAGERVVLGLRGSAVLTASGTYFKGIREIDGSLKYQDRGGNTWE